MIAVGLAAGVALCDIAGLEAGLFGVEEELVCAAAKDEASKRTVKMAFIGFSCNCL
jgi:hypothetical protein